jgi:endonuclease III
MAELKQIIARLKRTYGRPKLPPARGPFELVMWENACYLLPDDRRATVFEGLRKQGGLNAKAILKADADVLLALATMGGMRPKVRVFRWEEIARITLSQFDGDLDQILKLPYAQAKKALKQFPNIGDPGAEKILMFCGASPGMPLEWNVPARADPRWIWTMAEKLQRCVQISTRGIEAGTSAQSRDDRPGTFVVTATRKRNLPGQITPVL